MATGYVYVIEPNNLKIEGRSVVKIGLTTRSPQARLRQLQTGSAHRLSLRHIAKFPDVKWAEKTLHQLLSKLRVQVQGGTEFFFLTSDEAIQIVNALAYRVSAEEAQLALDSELEKFTDKISGGIARRCTFGAFAVFCLIFFYLCGGEPVTLLVAPFAAFFPTILFVPIAEKFVERAWRKEIEEERGRLLEKYPAAKHGVSR